MKISTLNGANFLRFLSSYIFINATTQSISVISFTEKHPPQKYIAITIQHFDHIQHEMQGFWGSWSSGEFDFSSYPSIAILLR